MSYVRYHNGGLMAGRMATPGWYIDMPCGHIKLGQVDSAIAASLSRKGVRTIKIQKETFPIV